MWSQTRVSFYATQPSYLLKTWKKSNFYMFYKIIAEQSSIMPICMINVSYERGIIVPSIHGISFMILLFVFQRFVIKSRFPFIYSHCIMLSHSFRPLPLGFLKYIDISLITAPPQMSFSMVENEMHTDGHRNAYMISSPSPLKF